MNSGFFALCQPVVEETKMKEVLLPATLTNLKSDAKTFFPYLF